MSDEQDILTGTLELEQAWERAKSARQQWQTCPSYVNQAAYRLASAKLGQALESLKKQVAEAKRRRHATRSNSDGK